VKLVYLIGLIIKIRTKLFFITYFVYIITLKLNQDIMYVGSK